MVRRSPTVETSSVVWSDRTPFLTADAPHVRVQGVLYNADFAALRRSVESIARAAEISMSVSGRARAVTLAYGDASPLPILDDHQLTELRALCEPHVFLTYTWFAENTGSARGHNLLAAGSDADFIFLTNPDIVVGPRVLDLLLEPFERRSVGMTEAKQLPMEHPKAFDLTTGETSWASGACSMMPVALFEALGGYDADSFFMYCDDVDLAWRVRQAGLRVVHQPAAAVFHDKRVGLNMTMKPTGAEEYYSAEAALILAHKWSRGDRVAAILADFDAHGTEVHRAAAAAFRARADEGRLPSPVDQENLVGQFVAGNYAPHRF